MLGLSYFFIYIVLLGQNYACMNASNGARCDSVFVTESSSTTNENATESVIRVKFSEDEKYKNNSIRKTKGVHEPFTIEDMFKATTPIPPMTQHTSDSSTVPTPLSTASESVSYLVSGDVCFNYGTCEFVSSLEFPYCNCDNLCSAYNDCCHDAVKNTSEILKKDSIICAPKSNVDKHVGTFIINQCPISKKNTELDQKCKITDIRVVGPWVIDEDGIVYQNKYCIECHSKVLSDVYSIMVSNIPVSEIDKNYSTVNLLLEDFLNREPENPWSIVDTVKIEQVSPKEHFARRCLLFDPDINDSHKCSDYSPNPVVVDLIMSIKIYRNLYCAPPGTKCLGSDVNLIRQIIGQYSMFPLSVIFPFGGLQKECEDVNGFCLGQQMYRGYAFSAFLKVKSNLLLPPRQLLQLVLAVAWCYPKTIELLSLDMESTLTESNKSYTGNVVLQLKLSEDMYKKEVLSLEDSIKKIQWQVKLNLPHGALAEVKIVNKDNFYDPYLDLYVNTENGLVNVMKQQNITNNIGSHNISFCGTFSMEVDLGGLAEHSAFVISSLKCIDETNPITSQTIQTIVTYTGMGISVVSLVVAIVIYRRTGLYKTIPGSNIENVLISLLLADTLFMVGIGANDNQVLCYIVGVFLHYFILCLFSFKSVALVYMAHHINKMSVNSTNTNGSFSKTKRMLTIIGLSLPLLFVFPAIILDQMEITVFRLHYDGSVCFPTGYLGNLIFLSSPIGLAILTNVCCLIGVLCVITITSHETRHVRKSSSFQYVPVFIRVSAVTGVFWISGILGIVLPTELTEYVFLCSCSFQGLFVSLAFLSTKQVARAIRDNSKKKLSSTGSS